MNGGLSQSRTNADLEQGEVRPVLVVEWVRYQRSISVRLTTGMDDLK